MDLSVSGFGAPVFVQQDKTCAATSVETERISVHKWFRECECRKESL